MRIVLLMLAMFTMNGGTGFATVIDEGCTESLRNSTHTVVVPVAECAPNLKAKLRATEAYQRTVENDILAWENALYVIEILKARIFLTCPSEVPAELDDEKMNWRDWISLLRKRQRDFLSNHCEFHSSPVARLACLEKKQGGDSATRDGDSLPVNNLPEITE